MKRDARLYVRLPETLKRQVQAYASDQHLAVSAVVVHLLTRFLADEHARTQPREAKQV